ncbi:dihydrofolate reductase [Candidatus Saccharibacteria bacterium]|nr:dihydrofolate reductase [Candidatus Saccharibacteria bacterium]
MSFSLIAAIGKNRELGRDGGLVFRLPSDLKFFKEVTMGHPILMGRKTFESLPKMLPGRKHYVVTRNAKRLSIPLRAPVAPPAVAGVLPILAARRRKDPATGMEQPLCIVDNLDAFVREHAEGEEEVFVIGGASIYEKMLPYCDKLYLTEVDAVDETADVFFPEVDFAKYTRKVLKKGKENGLDFAHVLYTKKK